MRGGAGRLLATCLVIASCLSASPAIAQDADASRPPETTLPVVGYSVPCDDQPPPGPGEVTSQGCIRFYQFLPAETSAADDFFVIWSQMEVYPGEGWCATDLRFVVRPSSDGRIAGASEERNSKVTDRTPDEVTFSVDADGTAPLPGSIHQIVSNQPGRLKVSMKEDHYQLRWKGSTPNKLVMAVGVEVASPVTSPGLLSTVEVGVGFGAGTCGPGPSR